MILRSAAPLTRRRRRGSLRAALVALALAATGLTATTPQSASAANAAPAVPAAPSAPTAHTAPVGPGGFVAVAPVRIYDSGRNQPLDGDQSQWPHLRQLRVTGRGGVPTTDVSAVVLNVTVAGTEQAGYLTVFPAGSPQPTTSNLNWNGRGVTTADLVLAKVGTDGLVSFVQSGYDATRLVVDLAGYVVGGPADTAAGDVLPLTPQRLLDTRAGLGRAGSAAVPGGGTVHLQVAGRGGVPAAAGAALLTVTVTGPVAAGYVTVHPDGTRPPLASNLNYTRNQTVPNLVLARLSADGKVALTTSATSHLVADVAGWVPTGNPTSAGAVTGLAPVRVLDTRTGTGTAPGPVGPGSTVRLRVTGAGSGVPAGAGAVVLNLTATGASAPGYVTAHPDGTTPPLASNLNYGRGQTVANLVVARLSADGTVALTVGGGATHLVADVAGWTASGWGVDSYVRVDGPWAGTVGGDVLPDARSLRVGLPPALPPSDAPAGAEDAGWAAGDCDVATGGCVAVGTYRYTNGNHAMVAVRGPASQNWSSWTVYPSGELSDVRCPGAGHCYATGFTGSGPVTPVVDLDVAAATATPVVVDVPERIRTRAVDCTGPGDCVAVGGIDGSTAGAVWTVVLHDGAWTATRTAVAGTDNAHAPSVGVRCRPGGALCMVYGDTSDGWTAPHGLLLAVRDGRPGTPTTFAPSPATQNRVTDVACWSDTGCLAVGTSYAGLSESLSLPLAYRGDGDTWSPVTVPLPAGLYGGALWAVGCRPSGRCVAGGEMGYRYESAYYGTSALVLAGTADALRPLETPPPDQPGFTTRIGRILCAPSSRCYLLGVTSDSPAPRQFVLHEPAA